MSGTSTTVTLPTPTTDEKLRLEVSSTADPTSNPSEWQLTARGAFPAADAWVEGDWSGTYSQSRATAVSPLTVTDLDIEAGAYSVWVAITIGSERIERLAGTLKVLG